MTFSQIEKKKVLLCSVQGKRVLEEYAKQRLNISILNENLLLKRGWEFRGLITCGLTFNQLLKLKEFFLKLILDNCVMVEDILQKIDLKKFFEIDEKTLSHLFSNWFNLSFSHMTNEQFLKFCQNGAA